MMGEGRSGRDLTELDDYHEQAADEPSFEQTVFHAIGGGVSQRQEGAVEKGQESV